MGELLENHQEGEDWGSLWIIGEERDFVLISGAVMNLLDSCSLLLLLHSLRGLSGGRLGPLIWVIGFLISPEGSMIGKLK